VKHRERLTARERQAFEQAVEWARMGTTGLEGVVAAPEALVPDHEKPAVSSGF
jgi:hypothetical protein